MKKNKDFKTKCKQSNISGNYYQFLKINKNLNNLFYQMLIWFINQNSKTNFLKLSSFCFIFFLKQKSFVRFLKFFKN